MNKRFFCWLRPLLAMVVVVLSPSFVDGKKCVQCGGSEYQEPCGQVLPPPSQCKTGGGCHMGMYINTKTGTVYELRECGGRNYDIKVQENKDGWNKHRLLCNEDECNSDRRPSERPPPISRCPKFVVPDQPANGGGGGGRLECIQCGWGFAPCGQVLPPPTRCEDKTHNRCLTGVSVNDQTGQVFEMRGCAHKANEKHHFETFKGNGTHQIGLYCKTSGCNFDAERRPESGLCPEEDGGDGGDVGGEGNTDKTSPARNSSPRTASATPNPPLLTTALCLGFLPIFRLVDEWF